MAFLFLNVNKSSAICEDWGTQQFSCAYFGNMPNASAGSSLCIKFTGGSGDTVYYDQYNFFTSCGVNGLSGQVKGYKCKVSDPNPCGGGGASDGITNVNAQTWIRVFSYDFNRQIAWMENSSSYWAPSNPSSQVTWYLSGEWKPAGSQKTGGVPSRYSTVPQNYTPYTSLGYNSPLTRGGMYGGFNGSSGTGNTGVLYKTVFSLPSTDSRSYSYRNPYTAVSDSSITKSFDPINNNNGLSFESNNIAIPENSEDFPQYDATGAREYWSNHFCTGGMAEAYQSNSTYGYQGITGCRKENKNGVSWCVPDVDGCYSQLESNDDKSDFAYKLQNLIGQVSTSSGTKSASDLIKNPLYTDSKWASYDYDGYWSLFMSQDATKETEFKLKVPNGYECLNSLWIKRHGNGDAGNSNELGEADDYRFTQTQNLTAGSVTSVDCVMDKFYPKSRGNLVYYKIAPMIAGYVYDRDSGAVIPGAKVKLTLKNNSGSQTLETQTKTTDSRGYYSFPGVDVQTRYDIEIDTTALPSGYIDPKVANTNVNGTYSNAGTVTTSYNHSTKANTPNTQAKYQNQIRGNFDCAGPHDYYTNDGKHVGRCSFSLKRYTTPTCAITLPTLPVGGPYSVNTNIQATITGTAYGTGTTIRNVKFSSYSCGTVDTATTNGTTKTSSIRTSSAFGTNCTVSGVVTDSNGIQSPACTATFTTNTPPPTCTINVNSPPTPAPNSAGEYPIGNVNYTITGVKSAANSPIVSMSYLSSCDNAGGIVSTASVTTNTRLPNYDMGCVVTATVRDGNNLHNVCRLNLQSVSSAGGTHTLVPQTSYLPNTKNGLSTGRTGTAGDLAYVVSNYFNFNGTTPVSGTTTINAATNISSPLAGNICANNSGAICRFIIGSGSNVSTAQSISVASFRTTDNPAQRSYPLEVTITDSSKFTKAADYRVRLDFTASSSSGNINVPVNGVISLVNKKPVCKNLTFNPSSPYGGTRAINYSTSPTDDWGIASYEVDIYNANGTVLVNGARTAITVNKNPTITGTWTPTASTANGKYYYAVILYDGNYNPALPLTHASNVGTYTVCDGNQNVVPTGTDDPIANPTDPTYTYNYDKTPPVCGAISFTDTTANRNVISGNVTDLNSIFVNANATDNLSGIKRATLEITGPNDYYYTQTISKTPDNGLYPANFTSTDINNIFRGANNAGILINGDGGTYNVKLTFEDGSKNDSNPQTGFTQVCNSAIVKGSRLSVVFEVESDESDGYTQYSADNDGIIFTSNNALQMTRRQGSEAWPAYQSITRKSSATNCNAQYPDGSPGNEAGCNVYYVSPGTPNTLLLKPNDQVRVRFDVTKFPKYNVRHWQVYRIQNNGAKVSMAGPGTGTTASVTNPQMGYAPNYATQTSKDTSQWGTQIVFRLGYVDKEKVKATVYDPSGVRLSDDDGYSINIVNPINTYNGVWDDDKNYYNIPGTDDISQFIEEGPATVNLTLPADLRAQYTCVWAFTNQWDQLLASGWDQMDSLADFDKDQLSELARTLNLSDDTNDNWDTPLFSGCSAPVHIATGPNSPQNQNQIMFFIVPKVKISGEVRVLDTPDECTSSDFNSYFDDSSSNAKPVYSGTMGVRLNQDPDTPNLVEAPNPKNSTDGKYEFTLNGITTSDTTFNSILAVNPIYIVCGNDTVLFPSSLSSQYPFEVGSNLITQRLAIVVGETNNWWQVYNGGVHANAGIAVDFEHNSIPIRYKPTESYNAIPIIIGNPISYYQTTGATPTTLSVFNFELPSSTNTIERYAGGIVSSTNSYIRYDGEINSGVVDKKNNGKIFAGITTKSDGDGNVWDNVKDVDDNPVDEFKDDFEKSINDHSSTYPSNYVPPRAQENSTYTDDGDIRANFEANKTNSMMALPYDFIELISKIQNPTGASSVTWNNDATDLDDTFAFIDRDAKISDTDSDIDLEFEDHNVVVINGDLEISEDILPDDNNYEDNTLLILVDGSVTIDEDVTTIYASIFANGNIEVKSYSETSTPEKENSLVVVGGLYADSVILNRNLYTDPANPGATWGHPAEQILYNNNIINASKNYPMELKQRYIYWIQK